MGAPAATSVTSNGIFGGDDPLKHSLLLLIVQIVVILSFSRLISFVFRPLRQPRVVAEIIGGILLGPTAFGHIPGFKNAVFPQSSINVLQTVANFGLIFFLFLVGLELDVGVLRKTGGRAMGIAAVGIVVPFSLGIPVSLEIFKTTGMKHSEEHFGLPFILFMGVALSITAFPVLARILTERKIMNTELGQIAVSAAAINDVSAWALLALAVAVTNSRSSPLVILWVFLASCAYLGTMFVIVRPFVHALAKKDPVPEVTIAIMFLLLLISSFATDAIGINVIFGAFIMGLIIPKDQPLSGLLTEKTEDFVSIVLLPLYFASTGLNVALDTINNVKAVSAFLLVTATAVVGKVVGTVVVAKLFGLGLRNSVALGFLMNCKGLVELVVLNIGLSKGVINAEIFAIMVLMALVTTISTTPMVMWLYKPARDLPPYKRRNLEAKKADNGKLRMLVCLYGMRNLPSMMSFIEMSKGSRSKLRLQVHALHLVEFSERFGAFKVAEVLKAADTTNDAADLQDAGPVSNDTVATSLKTFGQVNNIQIKVSRTMSRVSAMHEDICSTAMQSRANIIILPYHKYSRPDGTLQSAGAGFFQVNQCVLKESPCSVGILVDRGLGAPTGSSPPMQPLPHHQVLVLFFGGPDDREALLLGKRMAEHSNATLTIVQCIFKDRQGPAATSDNLAKFSHDKETGPKDTFQQTKDRLMKWGGRSLRWFRNHDEEEDRWSTQPMDNHSPASHHQLGNGKHEGDTKIAMDHLEQENEQKLDAKLMRLFRAAAANQSDRIMVKALKMDAVEELLGGGEQRLIIVGLRSSRPAEIQSLLQRARNFQSGIADHGLGPIGNWLVSKELQISVLVVWQHAHSDTDSLGGGLQPERESITDNEAGQSSVDFEEEPTSRDHR